MRWTARVFTVASFLLLLPSIADVSGAETAPRARVRACEPVVSFRPGEAVGDSTVVQGHTVPRTVAGLKPYYPKPSGFFPFYPGERVVIVLDGKLLGVAVFDGCRLLTEFQPPASFNFDSLQKMEIVDGGVIPTRFRDSRGYRALLAETKRPTRR